MLACLLACLLVTECVQWWLERTSGERKMSQVKELALNPKLRRAFAAAVETAARDKAKLGAAGKAAGAASTAVPKQKLVEATSRELALGGGASALGLGD